MKTAEDEVVARTPKAAEVTSPIVEESPPLPPAEPHPEDATANQSAEPTPRTLLKKVLGEVDENIPPPAVHTPTVMTIDDYEAMKKGGKSTKSRRKSIRTPKKVETFSPS